MNAAEHPDRPPPRSGSGPEPGAPSIGLIVNTYQQPEYLSRVLAAITRQSSPPDQVLVADDGSGEETRETVAGWGSRQDFPVGHAWQPNAGFRRSRVLNLAIAQARSDYLVFLDGDTIPHPRFIEDHRRLAMPGWFVQGHRALVGREAAVLFGRGPFGADRRRALLAWGLEGLKSIYRWPVPWRARRPGIKGIRGCNLAIWREDLIRVNGYNERFEGWGREDSELAVRLGNAGVCRLDVRGWALCYHLWHPVASRERTPVNDQLLGEALRSRQAWCECGLDAHASGGAGSRAARP